CVRDGYSGGLDYW
nr:immunoglobulin heavy chain junction region [Macaca mulatta]